MLRSVMALLCVCLLYSCGTYQYMTVNSPEMGKNDKKEFTWENDTVRVTYNFNGKGGPINLTVYNKTQQPLYIDWKKSAVIRDGHTIGKPMVGEVISVGVGRYSGSVVIPDGEEVIAPGSDIHKTVVNVVGDDGGVSTPVAFMAADSYYDQGFPVKYKKAAFDSDGSPLHFSVYLALREGDNPGWFFAVRHSFYVSEIMNSGMHPGSFALYKVEGDMLYTKLPSGGSD